MDWTQSTEPMRLFITHSRPDCMRLKTVRVTTREDTG
jgi:hypothetical protein